VGVIVSQPVLCVPCCGDPCAKKASGVCCGPPNNIKSKLVATVQLFGCNRYIQTPPGQIEIPLFCRAPGVFVDWPFGYWSGIVTVPFLELFSGQVIQMGVQVQTGCNVSSIVAWSAFLTVFYSSIATIIFDDQNFGDQALPQIFQCQPFFWQRVAMQLASPDSAGHPEWHCFDNANVVITGA